MLTGNDDNNSTSWLRYCWPSQFLFIIWTSYSSFYLSVSGCGLELQKRIYISNEGILILTFLQKFQPFLFCATGKSGLSAGQVFNMSQPPWSRHQVFDHQTQPWCPSFQLRSELSCHDIFESCLQTACIYKVDKMKAWCWKGKVQEIQIKIDSLFLNVAQGHTEDPLKM